MPRSESRYIDLKLVGISAERQPRGVVFCLNNCRVRFSVAFGTKPRALFVELNPLSKNEPPGLRPIPSV